MFVTGLSRYLKTVPIALMVAFAFAHTSFGGQPMCGYVDYALASPSFSQSIAKTQKLCFNLCLDHPSCKSTNYVLKTRQCALNNASHLDGTRRLKMRSGSFYAFNESTVDCSISSTEIQPSVLVDNAWIERSCQDFAMEGHVVSGIYTIYPTALSHGLQVYCDMETDGGGWIVIQRRQDGTVDFYRNWADYQVGFGDLSGEFWIGNDILRNLTEKGTWQLRVDLEDWDNVAVYAEYGEFHVFGAMYQLRVGSYIANSTAGDSLSSHTGKYFTTKDRDNDAFGAGNCAQQYVGGWWYTSCYESNLNGKYYIYQTQADPAPAGVVWRSWNENVSLKKSSMKIKRYWANK